MALEKNGNDLINTKYRASFQGPIMTVCHELNTVPKKKEQRGKKRHLHKKKNQGKKENADKPGLGIRSYQIMRAIRQTTCNTQWVIEVIRAFKTIFFKKSLNNFHY